MVETSTKNIVTNKSIFYIEHGLPKNNFVGIHRSFILSVNKIQTFTKIPLASPCMTCLIVLDIGAIRHQYALLLKRNEVNTARED